MATTGISAAFVDTNILVYAKLAQAPLHAVAVQRLTALVETGAVLWVSRQILREYLAAMTRPNTLTSPIPINALVEDVRDFATHFQVADDTSAVTEKLLALVEQVEVGGKQLHDANIVATMQAYEVQHLLTHNAADFARFAHLITVLPMQVV